MFFLEIISEIRIPPPLIFPLHDIFYSSLDYHQTKQFHNAIHAIYNRLHINSFKELPLDLLEHIFLLQKASSNGVLSSVMEIVINTLTRDRWNSASKGHLSFVGWESRESNQNMMALYKTKCYLFASGKQ